MSGELVPAVLGRIEADLAVLPGGTDAAWRGRVADEATLLLALVGGLEDGRPDPEPDPEPQTDAAGDAGGDAAAITAHLRDMAGREVPLLLVRRFVRAAAAAAFAELWHAVGPGDATALLTVSRRLARRQHTIEHLLRRAYEPEALPRTMEVV